MEYDVDYMAAQVGAAYLEAWRARDQGGNGASISILDEALRRRAVPQVWLASGRPRDVLVGHWTAGVKPARIRAMLFAEVPEACFETVRAQLARDALDTAARAAEEEALRPTFIGFFDRHASPITNPDLEDFFTRDGQHFDLFDLGLECTRIEFEPSTRTLVIAFEGAETDTLPYQSATFSFEDALIYQWDDVRDRPQHETPEHVHGFGYIAMGCFGLLLHDQWISWTSSSVTYVLDLGGEHASGAARADGQREA